MRSLFWDSFYHYKKDSYLKLRQSVSLTTHDHIQPPILYTPISKTDMYVSRLLQFVSSWFRQPTTIQLHVRVNLIAKSLSQLKNRIHFNKL